MPNIYPTQFCWKCGRVISNDKLFCLKPRKCEEIYKRAQDKQIRKSKRAGYGLAGSTH